MERFITVFGDDGSELATFPLDGSMVSLQGSDFPVSADAIRSFQLVNGQSAATFTFYASPNHSREEPYITFRIVKDKLTVGHPGVGLTDATVATPGSLIVPGLQLKESRDADQLGNRIYGFSSTLPDLG